MYTQTRNQFTTYGAQQPMTTPRVMSARYAGTCAACGKAIQEGDRIQWLKGRTTCEGCPSPDNLKAITPRPSAFASTPDAPVPSTVPDGYYTVVFTEGVYSGRRMTIRFKTPKDGNWAGRTILKYLEGSSNESESSYTAFGELKGDSIQVWGGRAGRRDMAEAAMQVLIDPVQAGLNYAMDSGRCCRCGRLLTVPASIHNGKGPECAKKD